MSPCGLLVFCLCISLSTSEPWLPRLTHTIPFPGLPAFMEVYADENVVDPVDSQTLYISTFNSSTLGQDDYVFALRSPGRYLDDPEGMLRNFHSTKDGQPWPNNPDRLPSSVVGREGIIWTSGFLVPGKKAGKLNMYFLDQYGTEDYWKPVNIASRDERAYSYHRVMFRDMDGDGDQDVITARFNVNLFGDITQDFSWLENPGLGPVEGWVQHQLIGIDGPDISFQPWTLPGGYEVFVAGQTWTDEIRIWYIEGNDWGAEDAQQRIQSVTIDNPGLVFDVYIDDFNRDGIPDLLSTVYNVSEAEGFVYIYQVPQNWMTDPWERFTLADNFVPNIIDRNRFMSPGAPKPFYPSKDYEEAQGPDGRQLKPYISVSGDDDGCLYILTPNSEAINDWSYTKNQIINTTQTTSGKMAIGDMDNDGYTDIIGAGYSANELYIFTFKP